MPYKRPLSDHIIEGDACTFDALHHKLKRASYSNFMDVIECLFCGKLYSSDVIHCPNCDEQGQKLQPSDIVKDIGD